MSPTNFVLALIDACGGSVSGRTLLQKRAFFASLLSKVDPGLSFDAHYYGPYSSTVDGITTQLKNLGFVEEKNLSFGVVSGGFEMKRYDYALTAEGRNILEPIRTTEEYKRISTAIKKINRAGNPDYLILSIAAKVYFILKKSGKPMSKVEIQKEAEKLNWNLQPSSLESAVNFLLKLDVTQKA